MLSVELGIAVALFELGLGVVVGNVFDLHSQQWLDFIATFASIVLTFLAGLEVDPGYFRERFAASVGIGLVSFIGPFVVASLVAYGLLDWTVKASLIAGTALSTTSLAVIYAVLVEDGLVRNAPDEHRAHLRHDRLALWLDRWTRGGPRNRMPAGPENPALARASGLSGSS